MSEKSYAVTIITPLSRVLRMRKAAGEEMVLTAEESREHHCRPLALRVNGRLDALGRTSRESVVLVV